MFNKKHIVSVVGIFLLLIPSIVIGDPIGIQLSVNNDLVFSVELNIYFPVEVSDPIYEDFSSVVLLDNYSAVLRIAVPLSAIDHEFINIKTNHNHRLNYTLDDFGRSQIDMYQINDYQIIEILIYSLVSFVPTTEPPFSVYLIQFAVSVIFLLIIFLWMDCLFLWRDYLKAKTKMDNISKIKLY